MDGPSSSTGIPPWLSRSGSRMGGGVPKDGFRETALPSGQHWHGTVLDWCLVAMDGPSVPTGIPPLRTRVGGYLEQLLSGPCSRGSLFLGTNLDASGLTTRTSPGATPRTLVQTPHPTRHAHRPPPFTRPEPLYTYSPQRPAIPTTPRECPHLSNATSEEKGVHSETGKQVAAESSSPSVGSAERRSERFTVVVKFRNVAPTGTTTSRGTPWGAPSGRQSSLACRSHPFASGRFFRRSGST